MSRFPFYLMPRDFYSTIVSLSPLGTNYRHDACIFAPIKMLNAQVRVFDCLDTHAYLSPLCSYQLKGMFFVVVFFLCCG